MTEKQPRAVIYVRLSRNRGDEQSASTKSQDQACRRLADAKGYDVAHVLVDDDISAYSGKRRPAYERLLELMRSKSIDVAIAWAPDRLHRSPLELEAFITIVEANSIQVETVQAGQVDLSTPAGRMQARLLGSVARYESEHRSERVLLAHDRLAAEGRWKGGKRPYGYRSDPDERGMLLVVPDEAAVIREMAERFLAGERIGALARDLNDRGTPTATGAPWSATALKAVLANLTVAGRRASRGEDAGPAVWPAILDADTSERIRALVASGPKRGRVPRVALLVGGLAVCADCGDAMRTGRKKIRPHDRRVAERDGTEPRGVRIYRCPKCLRQVVAEPLEALVSAAVVYRLETVELPNEHVDDGTGHDLAALREELSAIAGDYGAGRISRSEWEAARAPLAERVAIAERALDDQAARLGIPETFTDLNVASFGALPIDARQAIVSALIDNVSISAATRRGRGFDAGRVDIVWRF